MNLDFCGGSGNARSLAIDSQECVNFYPEIHGEAIGKAKAPIVLIGTPGLKLFSNLEPTIPILPNFFVTFNFAVATTDYSYNFTATPIKSSATLYASAWEIHVHADMHDNQFFGLGNEAGFQSDYGGTPGDPDYQPENFTKEGGPGINSIPYLNGATHTWGTLVAYYNGTKYTYTWDITFVV
jgi:hypothetical protein